jgi:hypothetical protein
MGWRGDRARLPEECGVDVKAPMFYIIIVSSIPALYRSWRDSPSKDSKRLNRMLLDAAIILVQTYQRDEMNREPDNFEEYSDAETT